MITYTVYSNGNIQVANVDWNFALEVVDRCQRILAEKNVYIEDSNGKIYN